MEFPLHGEGNVQESFIRSLTTWTLLGLALGARCTDIGKMRKTCLCKGRDSEAVGLNPTHWPLGMDANLG